MRRVFILNDLSVWCDSFVQKHCTSFVHVILPVCLSVYSDGFLANYVRLTEVNSTFHATMDVWTKLGKQYFVRLIMPLVVRMDQDDHKTHWNRKTVFSVALFIQRDQTNLTLFPCEMCVALIVSLRFERTVVNYRQFPLFGVRNSESVIAGCETINFNNKHMPPPFPRFPPLGITCMFSRVWQRLHDLARLAPLACLPSYDWFSVLFTFVVTGWWDDLSRETENSKSLRLLFPLVTWWRATKVSATKQMPHYWHLLQRVAEHRWREMTGGAKLIARTKLQRHNMQQIKVDGRQLHNNNDFLHYYKVFSV